MFIPFDLVFCKLGIMVLCLKNEKAISIKKFLALLFLITFWKSI